MKAQTQRRLRDLHNWFGVFFAPGILFFAFSGVLQTLSLHEKGPAGEPPPAWIGTLANVHKHQLVTMPPRKALPAPRSGKPTPPPPELRAFTPIKLFTVLLSLSLIASTLTGVWIALAQGGTRRRRTAALLVAGSVVPLLLLL